MNNAELIDLFRNVEQSNHPVCNGCPMKYTCDKNQITRCLFGTAADALEAADKRIAELEAQVPEWNYFETRNPTEDEQEMHPEWDFVLREPIPDDREEIIVTNGSRVWKDIFYNDDTCFLESESELEGLAWMPLPEPPNCGAKMRGEHDEN